MFQNETGAHCCAKICLTKIQIGHKENETACYCLAFVWHQYKNNHSHRSHNGWDKGTGSWAQRLTRSASVEDAWRVSSGQIRCNVIQAGVLCKTNEGRSLLGDGWYVPTLYSGKHSFPRRWLQTQHQLHCLFAWKHKWYALIPYSFIVEPGIVSMNGPNYRLRYLPVTRQRRKDD